MSRLYRMLPLLLTFNAVACAGPQVHGTMSALTANAAEDADVCAAHGVPADVCVRCDASRAPVFQAANDWCAPHEVPESQCFACHPTLSFEPLPTLPDSADLSSVPADDVGDNLARVAAAGKVTVVDVWAVWCVPCRNTLVTLHRLLQGDAQLAVRKIQLPDWDHPFAAAHLSTTVALPLVVVFDAKGGEVGRVQGHKPDALRALIASAR